MKTGLIYVRQSRHKEYERTDSPEIQEAKMRAHPLVAACSSVEVLRDLDMSGGNRKRPGYREFVRRLEEAPRGGPLAVVAVYDQSRTFRDKLEAYRFFALMEARPWIEVAFGDGSTFDRSNSGDLTFSIKAAVHEYERKEVGRRLRDAKRHAARKGLMVGAVPAGYIRNKDGSAAIDEPVAAIVRRIFANYAAGDASTQDIARRLNLEGVRFPNFTTGWRRDTVAQLLANPAYIARTYSERRSKRMGDVVAAQWPAIIDPATWDAVQAKLARWRRPGAGRRQQATGKERSYAFQGLLRCMTCGGPMHCHWMAGRAYYRCRGERAEGCKGVRDDRMREWARELMEHIEREADIRVTFAEPRRRERPRLSVERIDQTIERLGQRFEWGDIDEAAYRAKLADYRALRAEAVVELERAQAAQAPRPWPTNLVGTWEQATPASKRGLLAYFFEEIDVEGGRVVGGKLRPIDAALAEIVEKYRGSSPGGIRTRDLSLERAAS